MRYPKGFGSLMINTFYDFPFKWWRNTTQHLTALEFLHIKHPFSWTEFLSNFFFFYCSFTHCILYMLQITFIFQCECCWMRAKRRNTKMDLIWTCEGRTLWKKKARFTTGYMQGYNYMCIIHNWVYKYTKWNS